MSSYTFTVLDVFAEPYAVTPQLTARLRVEESTGTVVHAIALRCQVRIEPQRRGYDDGEAADLRSLFGTRDRWSDTLRPFMWMQCNTTVQGFTGVTEVDLPMPATYDFDVVGSRYLHAVGDGAAPLSFMFSGVVFTKGAQGFGVEQVPWDCDTSFQMPITVWKQMIDMYYPGDGWMRVDHDVMSALGDHRAEHGFTSWNETLNHLLEARRGVSQGE
ncbi:MAG: DUF6084 family protein [Aeromicrobium sp.]